MIPQAKLVAALKKALADAGTGSVTRRKNPAKPKRKSQTTGKKPSKRLVSRRKANTVPGYYPNPTAVRKAYDSTITKSSMPFCVQAEVRGSWKAVGEFPTKVLAVQYARAYAAPKGAKVRVIKY